MPFIERNLIKDQIRKMYEEILFIKFIFGIVTVASCVVICYLSYSLLTRPLKDQELYIKLVEMGVALFAPFISLVSQGFLYPKTRLTRTLRHLLLKRLLEEDEKKFIYEK